jgi:lysophospholipase L1-like esterase
MKLIDSKTFKALPSLACDQEEFMVLAGGAFALQEPYMPREGRTPPTAVLRAIALMLRGHVDALRSGNKAAFLILPAPLRMPSVNPPEIRPTFLNWLRREHPGFNKQHPHQAALSFDAFSAHMIRVLSMSGDIVSVHENDRTSTRLSRRLRKRIR